MIEVNQGDKLDHYVTLKSKRTKDAINLTGYTIYTTVKEKASYPDSSILISLVSTNVSDITILDEVNGRFILHFTRDHTYPLSAKDYYYDIRCYNPLTGDTISAKKNIFRVLEMVRDQFPEEVE